MTGLRIGIEAPAADPYQGQFVHISDPFAKRDARIPDGSQGNFVRYSPSEWVGRV
jgi:hypothetical protein